MSDLVEKLATAMSPALFSGRPDSEVGPGTRAARDRLRENARTALRVLAEHGDTQQVREQIAMWVDDVAGAADEVMAVVAPIVAARDAAAERARRAERERDSLARRLNLRFGQLEEARAARAQYEADLAAARTEVAEVNQQLDQVQEVTTELFSASKRNIGINDGAAEAYQHAALALDAILNSADRKICLPITDVPADHDESGQPK